MLEPEPARRGRPGTALAVALVVASAAWSFASAARYRNVGSDLTQDYLSAQALREGTSVYAPLPSNRALPTKEGETASDVVNDHPPPYIVALSPFGLLSYPAAFLMLAAASVVATVAGCAILARELGWSLRTGAFVTAGLLGDPGTVTGMSVGNISLLLFLLLALGWRAYRRDRTGWAGIWLGLATAIKLYPGLLVVGLLVGRVWRGVFVAGAVVVVRWAIAVFAVGVDDVSTYARVRAPANAQAYVSHGFNLSVAGVAHRLFGLPNPSSPWLDRVAVMPELAGTLAWVGRVCVGLIVAFGVLRARKFADYPDRAFAILVPGMLLLSPLTWLHAVPMMVIPVAILARDERGWRFGMLIACVAAMCVNDHWLVNQWVTATGRNVPWPGNLLLLAPTWGMLGVLVLASLPRRTFTAT